ncbi:MAG: hypothetical protein WCG80_16795 [Spirochaetales bacterium]
MALTQHDILALKEIFKPEFEAMKAQIADLKESLNASTESYRIENDRRRNDVHDLYTKDRERVAEHNELVARVVTIEGRLAAHSTEHDKASSRQKFSMSQRVAVLAVSVPAILWMIENGYEIIVKLVGQK